MDNFDRDSWQTPHWLFAALNAEFNFALDVAASDNHHLCKQYFTQQNSALDKSWLLSIKGYVPRLTAFCNPPYSRGSKEKFLAKAADEMRNGITSVFLVPALPSEGWFPWDSASEVRFITNGRVNFINPVTKAEIKGCPAGTCIVIFDAFHHGPIKVTTCDRNELRKLGESIIKNVEVA